MHLWNWITRISQLKSGTSIMPKARGRYSSDASDCSRSRENHECSDAVHEKSFKTFAPVRVVGRVDRGS